MSGDEPDRAEPTAPTAIEGPSVAGNDLHTAQVFLDAIVGDGRPSGAWMVALGAGAAAVGLVIAYFMFRSEASLVLVFLTALGVMPTVDRALVENRNAHEMRVHGDRPDERLARSLLQIFLGAFLLFGLVALFADQEAAQALFTRQLQLYVSAQDLHGIDFGTFEQVFRNNAFVLITVLLFATVYRAGGVALVLLWNASVWGAVLAWVARLSGRDSTVTRAVYNFCAGLIAVSPHMLFEALGYVMAAMAGVGIVRGLVKGVGDVKRPVVHMAMALGLLIAGAITEAILPELLLSLLVPR